jgi:hypothetical protein
MQMDDQLDEVIGKLSAAALQISPKDDQVIADHIRESVAMLLQYRAKQRGVLRSVACPACSSPSGSPRFIADCRFCETEGVVSEARANDWPSEVA